MKNFLIAGLALTFTLGTVHAQDATTLQVAPSDQVIYPDASAILNKTEPGKGLPTSKPLVASTPVAASPTAVPRSASADSEHGWFLKWTLSGDENAALGWVQALGLPASLHPLSSGLWEVWAGPLDSAVLKAALKGQGGVAVLVHR